IGDLICLLTGVDVRFVPLENIRRPAVHGVRRRATVGDWSEVLPAAGVLDTILSRMVFSTGFIPRTPCTAPLLLPPRITSSSSAPLRELRESFLEKTAGV